MVFVGVEMITHVEDRLGRDAWRAMRTAEIRGLGWAPPHELDDASVAMREWHRPDTGSMILHQHATAAVPRHHPHRHDVRRRPHIEVAA